MSWTWQPVVGEGTVPGKQADLGPSISELQPKLPLQVRYTHVGVFCKIVQFNRYF